ncbi:MAG: hypothetical protein ACLTYN_12330 [Dysosmobacter welbionis]
MVDMEALIRKMMGWAGVSEERLAQEGRIPQRSARPSPGNICDTSGPTLPAGGGRPRPSCTAPGTI